MSAAAMTPPPKQLFGPLDPIVETRPDGVVVVRTAQPLPPYPDSWIDRLEHWAKVAPDRVFLAERAEDGSWRELTYCDAFEQALRIGSALLARGLSAESPALILSGNSFEHALLSLAGMMVGAPTCPISTAYSLISQDLGKLKYALDLMTPRLVFASDARAYSRALELARSRGIEIAAGDATARRTRRDAVFGAREDPDLRRGEGGPRGDHAGRHRQVPADLGVDRSPQGGDQYPSDAEFQSGHVRGGAGLLQGAAAGDRRLGALGAHIRLQQQLRPDPP